MNYDTIAFKKRSVPSLPDFPLVPPAFLHSEVPTISICSETMTKFMLSATTADRNKEETG